MQFSNANSVTEKAVHQPGSGSQDGEALEEWESGISVGGRMVRHLRYADDITLLAGTKEDLT